MGSSGVKKDAFANSGAANANSGTANAMSSGLASNAGALYGSLAPTLQAEAAHPQGYTPQQKAAMNTAGQQSAGGSMSGAVGQGALLAARTKNAGAAQNAIQQSGRQSSQTAANTAVGTELANANLQHHQQQAGIQGEENLYNTELGGSMNALGLSNNALGVSNGALNTANNAQPGFWQQMARTAGSNLVNAGMDAGEAGLGF